MSSNSAWTGARPHIDESDLLCKTGCGFYGNPAWDGHCSICYKELTQKKQQRKAVFDPTQFKNKVSRSVSDVSEFQSKASSMMSKNWDKLEEKRRQQLDKKTKVVKSIFRKSQTQKGTHDYHHAKYVQQFSAESRAAINDFNSFFKYINKEAEHCLIKHIKEHMDKILYMISIFNSVDELGEQIHDFYNSVADLMATHPAFNDFSQEQVDKVLDLTERYITTRLSREFMNAANVYCEEKDLAIQNRIKSLMWVTAEHLECKVDESIPEVRGIMDQIITDLIEIGSKRVPMDKLNLLVSASNKVLNLLKQSSGGTPASADDFLPALIYCVLKANPPLLQSNICYITNFAQQSCLQSGEAGYFFTNLCCAVSFIEKLTADSLGLTQIEFDRYMMGDVLPQNALDGTYMCEGMRLMQQNLDNLAELEGHMNKLINSYEQIMSDVDQFKDNLEEKVDRVIDRTPLDIRPRKADIDDENPDQELLPPPLLPQTLQTDSSQMDTKTIASLDQVLMTPSELSLGGISTPSSEQSLAMTNKQHENEITKNVDQKKLDIKFDESTAYFPPYDFDPFTCTMDNSLNFDPFTSSGNYEWGNTPSLGGLEALHEEKTSPRSCNISGVIPKPSMHYLGSHYHHYNTIGPCYGINDNRTQYTAPQYSSSKPQYTGFTIQGGRIPNIPCDSGVGHSILPSPSQERSTPPDPLSPDMEKPQKPLPPPLIPTASAPGNQPANRQTKRDDKMVNLLGEFVATFDNLL